MLGSDLDKLEMTQTNWIKPTNMACVAVLAQRSPDRVPDELFLHQGEAPQWTDIQLEELHKSL